MGETRVDLWHLLEDLRDAYPGSLEETVLTEILANSLDSGATHIILSTDSTQALFTVVDNGAGMQRRSLTKYHDIAASTKTRGQGIGFAGVGIKLGLLVCEEVVTETRRGKTHGATVWHLASRYRAPWKWTTPLGLVVERGTAVRLKLQNPLSPLLDPGFLEATIRRHFHPLLDPTFDQFLLDHYPKGISIEVNGQLMPKVRWEASLHAPLEVRLLRKRKPSALGFLIRGDGPLPEEQRGLAISTFGKVIKRGWDWLGLFPTVPERIGGLIEVPELASSLTLNKGDFIRVGARGAAYLAYRKAIQDAVTRQLAVWGDAREITEDTRPRVTRPLERDLERVLENLSEAFPLLASLVEHRAGGQKRLPLGQPGMVPDMRAVVHSEDASATQEEMDRAGAESGAPPGGESGGGGDSDQSELPKEPDSPEGLDHPESHPLGVGPLVPGRSGPRRPARYGLDIQFEERPGDRELGRLVQSTVWINQAHPAYRRAVVSHSVGYHISLAVALALAPLAVEPKDEHDFVTAFLSEWGEELDRRKSPRRRGK